MGDSRRIFAIPGPSTRINMPAARVGGPVAITGSRPAYSSAVSNAWNNPSRSTASTSHSSSPRPSLLPSKNELRTTCLFCPTIVVIKGRETPEVIAERKKLLENMCFHLQANSNVLPTNTTRFQFPFCLKCEEYVKELMEFQEMLEKIHEKIAERVSTIERTVADKEILGSRPMSAIERLKFMRLYHMILDGHRKKLMKKRDLHNNPNSPKTNQNQPTFNPMRLRQFHGELPSSYTPTNSFGGLGMNEDNNTTASIDPLDVGEEVEVIDVNLFSSQDITGSEEHQDEINSDDDNEWNLEQSMNANYNESSCTLVISNVQSTAPTASSSSSNQNRGSAVKGKCKAPSAAGRSGGGSAAEAQVVNLMEIKQERLEEEDDDESEEEGDPTSADVYTVEEQKRRQLFEGVEILKCNGTGRWKNDTFLQCYACPFTLLLPKLTRREAKKSQEMSPYMKLKLHIKNVHKNNPGPLKPRAPSQFTCVPCDITFPNLANLRNHNKTHPVPKTLPCDICAKPITGTDYNLQQHKFSHKNDEEKRIALANNERGSYTPSKNKKKKKKKSLIETSQMFHILAEVGTKIFKTQQTGTFQQQIQNPAAATTPQLQSAGSSNGNTKPTPINTAATRSSRAVKRRGSNGEINDGLAKPFGCKLCNKHFSQKNHLTLHLRYHSYRKEGGEPIPSTSASALAEQSIGAGIASRRGQATVVLETLPPPTVPSDTDGEGLPPHQDSS